MRTRRIPLLTLLASTCVLALVATGPTLRAQNTPVGVADLLLLRTITGVQLAPDGSFAVYAVKSIEPGGVTDLSEPRAAPQQGSTAPADSYRYRSDLWLVRLAPAGADAKSAPIRLTHPDGADSDPRISPDGKAIAFVRVGRKARDGSPADVPKPQVWLLPLDSPGEARQLTGLEHGATTPRWRPDGKALVVVSEAPFSDLPGAPPYAAERAGRDWRDFDPPASDKSIRPDAAAAPPGAPDGDARARRNWLEANAASGNPVVLNRLEFQEEHSLRGPPGASQLYLVETSTDAPARRLTDSFFDHNDPVFSPAGDQIVFVTAGRTGQHPDRDPRTGLWRLAADGGPESALLEDSELDIDSPMFSPGGGALAFRAQRNDERAYRQARLGVVAFPTFRRGWLTGDFDGSPQRAVFWTDREVLFTADHDGATPIYRAPGATDPRMPSPILTGAIGVGAFDARAGRIVAAVTTPADPCELCLVEDGAPGATDGLRRLTDLNAGWTAQRTLSTPAEHWITRDDGTRVQYWLMPPADRDVSRPRPLLVEMHGGPAVMWGPGEETMWHEFQTFAGAGYGVLYCNPRGSAGYGYDFQKGNYKDWGTTPASDVLACLDDAAKNNAWIDTDQLFLTGGSYAGYLTAWIVGHDNRFKAACAQRGVYDLRTFFGEGNAWRLVPEAFGGYPWEPATREVLDRNSPFTYVDKITTPLLIIHSSSDLRTGVSQSEMLYRALKVLGRPVEYARYPGAGHDLSRTGDPRQRMDRVARMLEFFERFRAGAPSSASPAPPPAGAR